MVTARVNGKLTQRTTAQDLGIATRRAYRVHGRRARVVAIPVSYPHVACNIQHSTLARSRRVRPRRSSILSAAGRPPGAGPAAPVAADKWGLADLEGVRVGKGKNRIVIHK